MQVVLSPPPPRLKRERGVKRQGEVVHVLEHEPRDTSEHPAHSSGSPA
jgi:hypothetical protein